MEMNDLGYDGIEAQIFSLKIQVIGTTLWNKILYLHIIFLGQEE